MVFYFWKKKTSSDLLTDCHLVYICSIYNAMLLKFNFEAWRVAKMCMILKISQYSLQSSIFIPAIQILYKIYVMKIWYNDTMTSKLNVIFSKKEKKHNRMFHQSNQKHSKPKPIFCYEKRPMINRRKHYFNELKYDLKNVPWCITLKISMRNRWKKIYIHKVSVCVFVCSCFGSS